MRLLGLLILIFTLSACAPATQQSKGTPAQHRQWATELLSINDLEGAIPELRLAVAGNPNLADALLLADVLEAEEQFKGARKVYKNAAGYPADSQQKVDLNYRLGLLEASFLDNLSSAEKLLAQLPSEDSRTQDLQAVVLLKQGQLQEALEACRRALTKATNNEEKGWAYYHMAQIYYELRVKSDTFGSLFQAVNHGRGYSLVAQITKYWEERRHISFPKK
jgi:tetratricopeptide (TPR) repeat protein